MDETKARLTDFSVETTAISEFLNAVQHEYDCESTNKASFENRAGLILAFLGVLAVFLFDRIKLSELFALFGTPMTVALLIKLLSGFLTYLGFVFTIIAVIITISTRQQLSFAACNVTNQNLEENRYTGMVRLIGEYQKAIKNRFDLNEKRAKWLKKTLYGMAVTIMSIVIYSAM